MLGLGLGWPVHAQYQKGLQAYLDGDFKRAQQFWLKGAEAKDAKSMFNLGLLHEQEKVQGASSEKAENWYRLAGQHGYAAAHYHLALRLFSINDQDDAALLLMQKSSDAGYAPAQRYLGAQAILSSNQVTNLRSANWINKQNPDNWTIQLLAFNEKTKVEAFIKEHQLENKAAYFSERGGSNEVLFKLIYGIYPDRAAAVAARGSLPQAMVKHGPWLRQLSAVQTALSRRDK